MITLVRKLILLWPPFWKGPAMTFVVDGVDVGPCLCAKAGMRSTMQGNAGLRG